MTNSTHARVGALLLTLGWIVGCGDPAQPGIYVIESRASDREFFLSSGYVNDGTGSLAERTNLSVFSNAHDTKFELIDAGDDHFIIEARATGVDPRRLGVSSGANPRLISEPNRGRAGDAFRWRLTGTSEGYRIAPKSHPGLHLASPADASAGGTVDLNSGDLGMRSLWRLHRDDEPITFIREFELDAIGERCQARVISGDLEFANNGPHVYGQIEVIPAGNRLVSALQYHMRETRPDWTHGVIDVVETVKQLPRHWIIEDVLSAAGPAEFSHVTGFNRRFGIGGVASGTSLSFRQPTPVRLLVGHGDTGGTDVSPDFDCRDDSRIGMVDFLPARLLVTRFPNHTRAVRGHDTTLKPSVQFALWNDNWRHVFSDHHGDGRFTAQVPTGGTYNFEFVAYDAAGLGTVSWSTTALATPDPDQAIGWQVAAGSQFTTEGFVIAPRSRIGMRGTLRVDANASVHMQVSDLDGNGVSAAFDLEVGAFWPKVRYSDLFPQPAL